MERLGRGELPDFPMNRIQHRPTYLESAFKKACSAQALEEWDPCHYGVDTFFPQENWSPEEEVDVFVSSSICWLKEDSDSVNFRVLEFLWVLYVCLDSWI